MIVIYIPCTGTDEAKKIGLAVMKARLAPCYNILSDMQSAAFWPPKTGDIEEIQNGVVLLIKTIKSKYVAIESEIKKLHSDTNPCIFAVDVSHVSTAYYDWLTSEIE